ncbi:MAG: RNA polymerase sigma factor RpoD/SigA [Bacteroidota bacterium]|jgi:RNA polymerase primary sigma factor
MRQLKITKSITSRDSASLEKYLSDISKEEMISPDEEIVLAKKIREGDEAALDRLTRANLRFVVSVAKQYQNQGLTLPDLINEGNLGLIKAAKRFDETRGFKFISYAVWWIRQSIMQAISEHARIVRLPVNQLGSLTKINKAFTKLEQEYEREPSLEELAEITDLTVDKISDAFRISTRQISVDAPLLNGEDNSLLDVLQNKEVEQADTIMMNHSLKKEIERSLNILDEKERDVISLFFGLESEEPYTLEEIGEKYDLSRERVRQIKEKALKKLRLRSTSQHLKSFLGEE